MVNSGGEGPSLTVLKPGEGLVPADGRFCGEYRHSLDAKGRVAVPAQLRRELPNGSVVARGADSRLVIWPPDAWAAELAVWRRFAETPAQERDLLREVSRGAYPLELDAQGRMLLTGEQRSWANIADSVVFLGLGSGIEVSGDAAQPALDAGAYTRLHDVVHRAGGDASGATT